MRKLIFPMLILLFVSCSYKAETADYELPDKITVTKIDSFYFIAPQCYEMDEAIVFYPGGFVQPEAYIPLAADISRATGKAVFLQKMPFNLAVLGRDRVEKILKKYSYIGHWYMMGHSLGGVMAASWIKKHPGVFEGLILLASYPSDNDDLSSSDISVLSIRGSEDGLVSREKIGNTERLLPERTVFVEIQGGNHSQFGSYGFQKGDNPAKISEEAQRKKTVDLIASFLENINPRKAY